MNGALSLAMNGMRRASTVRFAAQRLGTDRNPDMYCGQSATSTVIFMCQSHPLTTGLSPCRCIGLYA
jgi:hypothetical protein